MPKTLDFHTSRFTITDGWLVDLLSGSVTATQASTAAPGNSMVGDVAAEGSATTLTRSDHTHGREAFGAATGTAGNAGANGTATTLARSDHAHAIASGITPTVGALDPPTANGQVTANAFAKGYAVLNLSAGTPTLDTNYNVSGIVDDGVGRFTIQWDRDFTSSGHLPFVCATGAVSEFASRGSGSVQLVANDYAGVAIDPANITVVAFGTLL